MLSFITPLLGGFHLTKIVLMGWQVLLAFVLRAANFVANPKVPERLTGFVLSQKGLHSYYSISAKGSKEIGCPNQER